MPISKVTDDQMPDIIAMYRSGAPLCDIAYKYGVTRSAICSRIKKAGEHMRIDDKNRFRPVKSALPEIMSLAKTIEIPISRRLLIDPASRAVV